MKTNQCGAAREKNLNQKVQRWRPGILGRLGAMLLLLPMLMAGLAHAQPCTPMPTNIIAWWPGDGHTLDVIGLRNAVLNNATYAPGLVGDAFSLTSTVARVRVLEDTSIDLSRMNRFTIETWINPASLGNSLYPTIYSEGNRMISLGLNSGTGLIESWLNGANRMIATNTPLQTGVWAHVALVYSQGVNRQLYVNGMLVGVSNALAVTDDSSGAGIGHVVPNNDPNTQFLGEIDELSLYSRALSAAEIKAIADAGTGGKCFPGGPAPVFVNQPTNQTGFLDSDATFTAIAMGTPRPTYQWLFRQTGQPAFTNLPSQTIHTLALTHLTFADDGEYALQATSTAGTTTSAVARLIVKFCTDTPTNLIAWWPGDGTGLDVTGNHHGAVWGSVTFSPGVVSNGPAFGFNGTDGYVAVCNSGALSSHVGTNGEMTVEAWVYLPQLPQPDPGTGQNRRAVLAKGDAGRWEYELSITTDGVPEFLVFNPNGSAYASIVSGQLLLTNWHHLVGTLRKGQFIRLYQDGALMTESTGFSGDTIAGATSFYIGRRSDGQFFNGVVDEPAFYNRALTSEEIAALHAGGRFGKCFGPTPGPAFTVQPSDKVGWEGNEIALEAMALGNPRPNYQWMFWGTNLPGATNAILRLTTLNANHVGPYTLVASNIVGITTSRTAGLTMTDFFAETETFETGASGCGWRGWTTDNYALWQIGLPMSGPGSAHSGANVAATVLGGYYPPYSSSRLVSPVTRLPTPGPSEELQLRFWHWFNYSSYDYGTVQISVQNPTNGQWSGWTDLTSVSGYSVVWTPNHVDLAPYAGKRVRIAFFHYATRDCGSCGSEADGWYIDDVQIWKGVPQFRNPEGWELGWGDWYADQGTWEVGRGSAYSGSNVAATVMSGSYYAWGSTRLISPSLDLPRVAPGEELQMRFWHWFNYSSYDYGTVQVSVYDPTNRQWSGWTQLSSVGGYSVVWTPCQVDLNRYASQRVRLAFYHYATRDCGSCGSEADGWYIDDVQIWKGVPQFRNPEGWELGWGDWYADQGTWEVGRGSAYSGSNVAATVMSGSYYAWGSTRLISPPIDLPPSTAGQTLHLCYRENYSYAYLDSGSVQVSTYNTTNQQWDNWIPLRTVGGSSGGWISTRVPLSDFEGQRIRVAFYHYATRDCGSCGSEADGWYIDDVYLKRGNIAANATASQTVNEINTFGLPSTVTFQVQVLGADPGACLSYTLPWAPPGAWIDPATGGFTWTPDECQGPGTYRIPIYVVDYCNNEANDLTVVQITVNEVNERPWLQPFEASVDLNVANTLQFCLCEGDPDCPQNRLTNTLLAPIPAGASIHPTTGCFTWTNITPAQYGLHTIRVRLCDNGSPSYCVTNTITVAVATNATFWLVAQPVTNAPGMVRFTLLNGRTDVSYMLQDSLALEECPGKMTWRDLLIVSPTEMPYSFLYGPQNPSDPPVRLFRLEQASW